MQVTTTLKDELELLKSMKCQCNEFNEVPSQISDLSNGHHVTISPILIPYIKHLLKITESTIGEDQLKVHGHEMIKFAKSKVFSDSQLIATFTRCMDEIQKSRGIIFDTAICESLRVELTQKIFNARVNEFFKARKELNLEATKKVVDCDQSLRDSLKTFSCLKSR